MAYGTIAADVITGTNGNTFSPESSVFRNRIINGAMAIDQRSSGSSFTPTTTTYYGTCDRWAFYVSQNSKLTAQRSSTAPTGFKNSIIVTSSSAYSVLSSDYFTVSQAIEGLNVADLDWGTANAKTVTLSFWVRSSLTGTFGGTVQNSAQNRSYPFSYTISSANTFEYKTITIPGDTTGTWLTTNGIGITLQFGLGVGSSGSGTANAWSGSNILAPTGATSVVGTNGATWYITGVQLEVGSQATSFDYRQYGTELALCQRYYYKVLGGQLIAGATAFDSTTIYDGTPNYHPVTMRTDPTVSNSGTFTLNDGLGASISTTPSWTTGSTFYRVSGVGIATGLTTGRTYYLTLNSNAQISVSAEL